MDCCLEKPGYFTPQRQEAQLRRLRREFPFVYMHELTRSAGGRAVWALQIGSGDRKVLLTAGHHGNETVTSAVLWRFLLDYCEALRRGGTLGGVPALELYHRTMAYLVPLVNPDGAALAGGELAPDAAEYRRAQTVAAHHPELPFPFGWKANLAGVDLNLNYPARWEEARSIKAARGFAGPAPRDFPGWRPLDQPETAALAAYTACIRPDLMLALHAQGQVIYPGPADSAPEGSKALGAALAAASGYALEEVPPESANAGFKDWFLQRFHRPAFTVECGCGENPLPPEQEDEIYASLLPLLCTALGW